MEAERISGFAQALVFLFAVYALFHCAECYEAGAVDLGQHQSPLLLVDCLGADRGAGAGAPSGKQVLESSFSCGFAFNADAGGWS